MTTITPTAPLITTTTASLNNQKSGEFSFYFVFFFFFWLSFLLKIELLIIDFYDQWG